MSGAHVVAQMFAYGSLLVLAHFVAPRSFGTVATGTAILYVGTVLMNSGTGGSIVVAPEISQESLRSSRSRCLLVGCLLSAAIALGAPALSGAFGGGHDPAVLAALGVGIPIYALAVVPMAVLQRALRFRELARVSAAANFLSAAVAVAAGVLGAGVWALVLRQLAWCAGLAALATLSVNRHVAVPRTPAIARPVRPMARWFLLFAVTQVVTFNLDYFVIGWQRTAAQLGLYSVAFMIAFAPLQHFSAEVGKVLFAAAAAGGMSASAGRTLVAMRLMTLILLPTLPVMVVLAPVVLPALLGREWSGMVVPFQLLAVAGIGYSIVNCIGEALAGAGRIDVRVKLNTGWCVLTLALLVALVHLDGIRGAALAHVIVFIGYGAVYLTAGIRRAGTDARTLGRALAPVLSAVAVQALVTFVVAVGLRNVAADRWLVACSASFAGLTAMVAVALRGEDGGPLRQATAMLRAATQGAAT
jgi:O-antigen/teichoic acid export membrane protein